MTTQQTADRLVGLCRQGKFEEAQEELFATNAVSIEPYASPDFEKETKGLPAIIDKGRKFTAKIETMHSMSVSDPIVAGKSFACTMSIDVTMKGEGRMNVSEICLYQLKDGKVISEQFYV